MIRGVVAALVALGVLAWFARADTARRQAKDVLRDAVTEAERREDALGPD
jgi:hypothetical protein